MATMNPVFRLRRVFRSMGAEEEQAEEAASVIDEEYVGRSFFEVRMNQQTAELRSEMTELRREMAELRKDMADLRNQILLSMILIMSVAVTVLSIVIAVFT